MVWGELSDCMTHRRDKFHTSARKGTPLGSISALAWGEGISAEPGKIAVTSSQFMEEGGLKGHAKLSEGFS